MVAEEEMVEAADSGGALVEDLVGAVVAVASVLAVAVALVAAARREAGEHDANETFF
jgi:hypothetical protein